MSETGSTNKDLLDAGREGAAEGRVLITDHQTAGRGRQGRAWVEQPETSLLMSILLRPDAAWAPLIPLAMGLAVVSAVERLSRHPGAPRLGLKWPNDVLVQTAGATAVGERKLAGILAEAITVDGELVVVVGCGINLRPSVGLPADVAAKAIALSSVLSSLIPTGDEAVGQDEAEGKEGTEVDRFELARSILKELEAALVDLEAGRSVRVLDAYRSRCVSIGRDLRLDTPSGELVGRAVSVGEDGALNLDTGSEIVSLRAGEAHHV